MIGCRFLIENLIGQGSFASVYQGTDSKTGSPVAIKQCSKRFKSLFKLECEVLSQLSGKPGFPKLLWQGESEDSFFIVMKLLGAPLSRKVTSDFYTTVDTCNFAQQLLKILEKLHESCFLHKDIKPENIVTGRKNDKKFHLIDFGLAKKYFDKSNNFHMMQKTGVHFKGNLIFCSDNVLTGIEASRRDDVISVLLICICMARRGLPWSRDTQSVESMVTKRQAVSFASLVKGVPFEISQCYEYALSLGFYQKPDYLYMINLLAQCKNFYLQDRTEEIRVRSKKVKKGIKRVSVLRCKTQVQGVDQLLSACSTIKMQAPDFSNDLRKKINLMRRVDREETLPGVNRN
jgi:serine/threonine protein kinase